MSTQKTYTEAKQSLHHQLEQNPLSREEDTDTLKADIISKIEASSNNTRIQQRLATELAMTALGSKLTQPCPTCTTIPMW